MEKRIHKLLSRLEEVETFLGSANALADKKAYKELTREHAYLNEIKEAWDSYKKVERQLSEDRQLIKEEADEELIAMLKDEIPALEIKVTSALAKLENLLVPPDPFDNRNTIVEIRAGTGGDEAALFVGDMVRMYQLFAQDKGWKTELLSCAQSELGGYREYIMVVSGEGVHRLLQYEAGTHRVQRVPATETQGRVHTSAVTIAILMEPDEDEKVELDEKDLKIDTYRASCCPPAPEAR